MAARQHSRFVHFVLPWLISAAVLVLYVVTLHPWVSIKSADTVAKVAGWEWNTLHLSPVTLLVTWPLRWLPSASQPWALNLLSAILAALTVGLLAKSVALLPHDRTREQRQRERSDFGFLTIPLAWVPPVTSAALLGVQLTFWEAATAMSSEMVSLTLFAFCVFCFLRFRVLQEDKYLAWLSFAFGAAAANDWGIVGFCPLFVIAILAAKGIAFFEAKFLTRTTLAGLAGAAFYLLPAIVLKSTGQASGSFFEILRASLSLQREAIISYPRYVVFFAGLTSVLPLFVASFRWPSTFGDMSAAGAAVTNFLFRAIHVAFLVFCGWTMFDPPFSPRQMGFGLSFLPFYFLCALAIGYMAGYLLLVLGQEPERKLMRTSEAVQALSRGAAGLVALASLASIGVLAARNLPSIRGQNGPYVRELAETLIPPKAKNPILISDENLLLVLARGALAAQGRAGEALPLNSQMLRYHVYQRHHEAAYGPRWPALAIERLPEPLTDDVMLRQIVALTYTNAAFYLHPSFGFFFEPFSLVPNGQVYQLDLQPTNSAIMPALPEDQFAELHRQYSDLRKKLVEDPLVARLRERRVADAIQIGAHYSRSFNAWGVALQRRERLEDAQHFFEAALQLNPENLSALINIRYNAGLRAGNRAPIVLDKELDDQMARFRDLQTFLSLCGPVDEPMFCFKLGRIFVEGNLNRQAVQQLHRAHELHPKSLEIAFWLANASLNAHFYPDVIRLAAEIRAHDSELTPAQKTDLIALESWAHYRSGHIELAENLLNEAHRRFPERAEPLQTLNDIYVAANRTNAALSVVEKLIQLLPDDARPLITKSAIQMKAGAHSESIATLTQVLNKQPTFFPALVNRALAYTQMGRLDDAEKDYLKLLEIAPKLNIIYYHLGEIDFQRGKADEARKHYQAFLENAPANSAEGRLATQRLSDIASGKIGK